MRSKEVISNKLLELLGSLNKKEMKILGDFLRSPYHNRSVYVLKLYEELVKYYPNFKSSKPEKKILYSALYPGPDKKYSDTRMRNITSDLFILVQKFISIERFSADKFAGSIYFLGSLPAKELDDIFERSYRKTAASPKILRPQTEAGFLERLQLLEVRSVFVNRRKTGDAKENLECYQDIVDQSVKFFLSTLLKNYALMLNKQITFFKFEYDTSFIDIILGYMEKNLDRYIEDTCIILYYYFTLFYLNYDESSLKTLEEFTEENFYKLDKNDVLNAITNMTTFCRRQALAGRPGYEQKALGLFRLGLNGGLWSESNKIRPVVFRVIVSSACSCGEFDWCEKFIEEYSQIQPKEHIQANTDLCYARLYFDKKEYGKAMKFLARISIIDSTYKYEVDTLLIRLYYETGETEAYISKVDAFRKWVNNNKTVISARYRTIFKEMALYFERLMKLRLEPDEFLLQKMRCEIEENKTLVNRLWFLEKLQETRIETK